MISSTIGVTINRCYTIPRENALCDIPIFNWSKADDRQKEAYQAKRVSLLKSIELPTDVLSCTDKLSDNVDHVNAITSFYENICKSFRMLVPVRSICARAVNLQIIAFQAGMTILKNLIIILAISMLFGGFW